MRCINGTNVEFGSLMRRLLPILFVFAISTIAHSQDTKKVNVLRTEVIDGDTIPLYIFEPVTIYEQRTFASGYERNRYNRLKHDVMTVYPYAKLAGERLRYYESQMDTMANNREQKKFLRQVEQDLQDEFGEELEDLTIRQGTILIALVDRETGDTSYELVKELRGTVTAFFWQGIARVFGHNLKDDYDPEGDEEMIEDIILRIENGEYSLNDEDVKRRIQPTPHMEPRVN